MREKILDEFLKRLDTHNMEQIKQHLDLVIPKHNTRPLEDGSNDIKPDPRAEKMIASAVLPNITIEGKINIGTHSLLQEVLSGDLNNAIFYLIPFFHWILWTIGDSGKPPLFTK